MNEKIDCFLLAFLELQSVLYETDSIIYFGLLHNILIFLDMRPTKKYMYPNIITVSFSGYHPRLIKI